MSPRRNWDSPNPSLASEFPSTQNRGGHTCLRVRGWVSPNSDNSRKSGAHCLLCALKYFLTHEENCSRFFLTLCDEL